MFFITAAHSGTEIPSLLKNRINPKANIREIAEAGIHILFQWPSTPMIQVQVHQCFPNLNRSRANSDPRTGKKYSEAKALFPLTDFRGISLYAEHKEPTKEEQEILLKEFYDPFYTTIEEYISSGRYTFFLDAHAMNSAATSYKESRHDPALRPDICLGNNGDERGQPYDGDFITFPSPALEKIKDLFILKGYKTELNRPFRGGNIIQSFGKKIPCIQVEISKQLYMSADDGDMLPEKMNVLSEDLKEVFSGVTL